MTKNQQTPSPLKPMGFSLSLLFFGATTVVTTAIYFALLWALRRMGVWPYYAHLFSFLCAILPLLIGSLVALRKEGHPLTWEAMKQRFRFRRMTGRAWLWLLIVVVAAAILTFGIFSPLKDNLIASGVYNIPDIVPDSLNPESDIPSMEAYKQDVGGKIVGNWWPFFLLFIVNFISVTSEEFWWRGVILPRQELALGKWAWVVHGLLWAPFHLFKYWEFIGLIPIALGIAFLASRTKNTTPAFILHLLVNVVFGVAATALIAAGLGN